MLLTRIFYWITKLDLNNFNWTTNGALLRYPGTAGVFQMDGPKFQEATIGFQPS